MLHGNRVAGFPVTSQLLPATEAVKWLALIAMIVDHTNVVLFDRSLGMLAEVIGRLAFPLFAAAFGVVLAQRSDRVEAIVSRLWPVAVITQPVYALTFDIPIFSQFNALAVFLVAAVVWRLRDEAPATAIAVFVLGGLFVEYRWPGVALVLAAAQLVVVPTRRNIIAVLLALGAVSAVNGNAWALLAVPAGIGAIAIAPSLPRVRGLFLVAYPGHIVLLAVLAAMQRQISQ